MNRTKKNGEQQVKLTLLDFIILGLVKNKPLSGYRIRKLFEETALGNYSSSPGSIYPALKRLLKFKMVKKTQYSDSNKPLFQIEETGIEILKEWLIKPIEKVEMEKKGNEILLRFAFMDELIKKEEKIEFLKSYRTLLSKHIKELQFYYQEEKDNMSLNASLVFEYGIESYITTLRWCKKTIVIINKNE